MHSRRVDARAGRVSARARNGDAFLFVRSVVDDDLDGAERAVFFLVRRRIADQILRPQLAGDVLRDCVQLAGCKVFDLRRREAAVFNFASSSMLDFFSTCGLSLN